MLEFAQDIASEIGFAQESSHVTSGVNQKVVVPVLRTFSNWGRVAVGWATREHSAEAGKDFMDSSGMVEFKDGQSEAYIEIPLLDSRGSGGRDVSFIVELGEVEGDASVGRYETIIFIERPSSDSRKGLSHHFIFRFDYFSVLQ